MKRLISGALALALLGGCAAGRSTPALTPPSATPIVIPTFVPTLGPVAAGTPTLPPSRELTREQARQMWYPIAFSSTLGLDATSVSVGWINDPRAGTIYEVYRWQGAGSEQILLGKVAEGDQIGFDSQGNKRYLYVDRSPVSGERYSYGVRLIFDDGERSGITMHEAVAIP